MQALHSFGGVTGTLDSDLSKDSLQSALVKPLLDPFVLAGALHRRDRLARTTHFDMRLQKLPHQLAATLFEFSLQITFFQAAGLLGAQKRLDHAEAFTRISECIMIHRRLRRHASALPQLLGGIM